MSEFEQSRECDVFDRQQIAKIATADMAVNGMCGAYPVDTYRYEKALPGWQENVENCSRNIGGTACAVQCEIAGLVQRIGDRLQ